MSEEKYKPNELPLILTKKMYVHYFIEGYQAGELTIYPFDSPDDNRIVIAEAEVAIDIPPIDKNGLTSKAVEMLKAQKKKIMAESEMKLRGIQDKIDNLLVIEYKPTEEAA